MSEKIALVTGATSGIGVFIAQGLVKAGYRVIVAVRSASKAREMLPVIGATGSKSGQVTVEEVDLASLASVEDLARRISSRYPDISLLVNNAGVFSPRKTLSKDGFELDMAVNHLAPFLLTWRLLPLLNEQKGARVVNVNSDSHEKAVLDPGDLEPQATFKMMSAYGKSKLASMLTTVEFARRIEPAMVTFNAVHPGAVGTNIGNSGGITDILWAMAKPFLLKPEQGAVTPLWVATSKELEGASGNYYKKQALARMNPLAEDTLLRSQVWERTLQLVGLPKAEVTALKAQ